MTRNDIAALVQDDRVHRDLYLSPVLFALEQRHFFANTWNYVGHTSQVPGAGDYITLEIAGRPLLMVRQCAATSAAPATQYAARSRSRSWRER